MAVTVVNKLYSILLYKVNIAGLADSRKKTTLPDISLRVRNLVDALIPNDVSNSGALALAELYIRLIYTDKTLKSTLDAKDPINTYGIVALYPKFYDTITPETLAKNVGDVAPECIATSNNAFDTIRSALEVLLTYID